MNSFIHLPSNEPFQNTFFFFLSSSQSSLTPVWRSAHFPSASKHVFQYILVLEHFSMYFQMTMLRKVYFFCHIDVYRCLMSRCVSSAKYRNIMLTSEPSFWSNVLWSA